MKTVCAKEYVDACVQNIDKKIKYGEVTIQTTRRGGGQTGEVNIPVDFPDTDYNVQLTLANSFPYFGDATLVAENKTPTSFTIILWINTETDLSSYNKRVSWVAIHK